MSELSEQIEPLLKRARVKDGTITLDEISEFIEDKNLPLEDVLAYLEDEDIEVAESSTPISDQPDTGKTSLQIYFNEISEITLLDPDQEIDLSRQIQEAREDINELCEEYEVDEEERETIVKSNDMDLIRDILRDEGITHQKLSGFMRRLTSMKDRYREAHSEMVEANLRLVVTIAKKYQHCGLNLDDLINEGNLGLMKAVDRFDYKKGYRFSTYAAWWIRQSILRAISNKGRTIRLPVYMNDLVMKWNRKKEELVQELDREPHMMEVADALNIDYEKAIHIMRHTQSPSSLEAPVGDDESAELKDMIESEHGRDTEHKVDEQFMREKLWEVMEKELTEKERFVFIHRYGLKDREEKTLEDVGEEMDLTRERVRQIQEDALDKIRNSKLGEELKEFLFSLVQ